MSCTPQNGYFRVVRHYILVLVVATHIEVSNPILIKTHTLLRYSKGKLILTLGQNFAMTPLETAGRITHLVLQHVLHKLSKVSSPHITRYQLLVAFLL